MKLTPTALALACLAVGGGRELSFAPAKGVALTKSFAESLTWKLESWEWEVDGEPLTLPRPDLTGAAKRTLVVRDLCTAAEDGVATRLERELQVVEGSSSSKFAVEGGADETRVELASALAGANVVFERKDAKSPAAARFADDSKADAKPLAGLSEELDLRALLPDEDVEVGGEWKVDATRLVDLLRPGGDVALLPRTGFFPDSPSLDPSEVAATTLCTLADNTDELSGEARLTWESTRQDGERELALIEVELEFASRTDLGRQLQRRLDAAGAMSVRDDLALLMQCSASGKGELVWDLTAHRCVSFQVRLDTHIDARFSWTDQEKLVGYHLVLAGQDELSASIEAK